MLISDNEKQKKPGMITSIAIKKDLFPWCLSAEREMFCEIFKMKALLFWINMVSEAYSVTKEFFTVLRASNNLDWTFRELLAQYIIAGRELFP